MFQSALHLNFLFVTLFCDLLYSQVSQCSSSSDGGSHCYTNCTPTALRYYGTCNYTHFCNYVALQTNYSCVPSYVILVNGSYSYYVAGIYVDGNGVGHLQQFTNQYCNSIAVGGALDNDCFDTDVGGPWTNEQKRSESEKDDELSSAHESEKDEVIKINSYEKFDLQNDQAKKASKRSVSEEMDINKIESEPKNQKRNLTLIEKEDSEHLGCNLLGTCDPSWNCPLQGSSLTYPINLSSCCFALINLNLSCACSKIAAALGFYPTPEVTLGFICLP